MKKRLINISIAFMLGLSIFLFMGAFTRDWTESTPTDATIANQIDDFNRYLRVDMSDRLKNMLYGFIAGENTLTQHFQYLQFYEQASISDPAAGYGKLGCKAVSGKCELFWHDEDDDEIQLTSGGKLNGAVLLAASIPSGSYAADSIDSADYAAASIDAQHLAADIISETKIADNGIDSEHYNDGSIDLAHLSAGLRYTPTSYTGGESVTFPNGLILKQGYIAGTGTKTITFGTAFPTGVISGLTTPLRNDNSTNYAAQVKTLSTSAMVIHVAFTSITGTYWQVWGY